MHPTPGWTRDAKQLVNDPESEGEFKMNDERRITTRARSLVALSIALLGLLPSAGLLQAENPEDSQAVAAIQTSQSVGDAARAVSLEQVYGPLYRHYKSVYPARLDWNNNGCSVPAWMDDIRGLGGIIAAYGGEFQKSCDRHDFGYRNHGVSGLDRHTIDVTFRDNMYHQCNVNHWDGSPLWIACRGAAKTFFEVVDEFGGGHW
jgi:Prokaryotic phospholipase A2